MSKEENFRLLKIQTTVLKVHIHCDGCKKKVKKILQKIEGVYEVHIEEEVHKVTVVANNVRPEDLIRKLSRAGKPAEVWPTPGKANAQKQSDQKKVQFDILDEKPQKAPKGGDSDQKPQKGMKGLGDGGMALLEEFLGKEMKEKANIGGKDKGNGNNAGKEKPNGGNKEKSNNGGGNTGSEDGASAKKGNENGSAKKGGAKKGNGAVDEEQSKDEMEGKNQNGGGKKGQNQSGGKKKGGENGEGAQPGDDFREEKTPGGGNKNAGNGNSGKKGGKKGNSVGFVDAEGGASGDDLGADFGGFPQPNPNPNVMNGGAVAGMGYPGGAYSPVAGGAGGGPGYSTIPFHQPRNPHHHHHNPFAEGGGGYPPGYGHPAPHHPPAYPGAGGYCYYGGGGYEYGYQCPHGYRPAMMMPYRHPYAAQHQQYGGADDPTHFFSDENTTSSCSLM
eukprot:TRINITY_DN37844_c0_g1_i1.p1 TRINITY_DN37844_c0_g1~~TRINITY_DN37844_c0_g1_i1.p1  ORF type:complete len:445 (-),score=117.20 TRINITY_DN37844_c0_g1_i1:145-1479(-)